MKQDWENADNFWSWAMGTSMYLKILNKKICREINIPIYEILKEYELWLNSALLQEILHALYQIM